MDRVPEKLLTRVAFADLHIGINSLDDFVKLMVRPGISNVRKASIFLFVAAIKSSSVWRSCCCRLSYNGCQAGLDIDDKLEKSPLDTMDLQTDRP